MRSRSQSGFTLIELMVVVVVVAILAAMAAPSYRDMIDRFRVRGAADDVLSVLSNARAGAVKAGLDTVVSSISGNNWCVGATSATPPTGGAVATGPTACTCSTASACLVAGEQLAVPVGKHAGVSMANATAVSFTYDAKLGTVVAANAVSDPLPITLTSPTGRYDVNVDVTPLGQARLCTPTGKPAMAGISAC